MKSKTLYFFVFVVILGSLLLSACAQGAAETPVEDDVVVPTVADEPASDDAGEETSDEVAMEEPKELNVAAIFGVGLENDWDGIVYESWQRIQANPPHGLTINDLVYTEGVWGDDAARVMREYAETGMYDIVWANSSYSDQVKELKEEFPETLFVLAGYGNEGLGGNSFYVVKHIFEPSYLMGAYAGLLTETNVIGSVAPFPYDDVNAELNGFFEGALSVNPDVKVQVTFIESWWDPPKAIEAANAQIAAGVDNMFMRSDAFESCEDELIFCYGPYVDNTYVGPNSVLTNALAQWDPEILWVIDQWWAHKTTGEPYNAPVEPVWFRMGDGASSLQELNEALLDRVPEDVISQVEEIKQQIEDGVLIIEPNLSPPDYD